MMDRRDTMADLLLSPALYIVLLMGAALFAFLASRRPGLGWTVPAALCTIAACLLGLAAGRSLEQLLTAVLIPTAIVLADRKGGGSA